jgi:hypothetical protein
MAKTTLGDKAGQIAASAQDATAAAKEKVKAALPGEPAELHGPSPNPHTNLLLADVALRGSSLLMRRAMERGLLGSKYPTHQARAILKGRSWSQTLLHTAIARVAVRSVPGAILVGGGLLAKTLYDRSRSHVARAKGEVALQEMAQDGKKK